MLTLLMMREITMSDTMRRAHEASKTYGGLKKFCEDAGLNYASIRVQLNRWRKVNIVNDEEWKDKVLAHVAKLEKEIERLEGVIEEGYEERERLTLLIPKRGKKGRFVKK